MSRLQCKHKNLMKLELDIRISMANILRCGHHSKISSEEGEFKFPVGLNFSRVFESSGYKLKQKRRRFNRRFFSMCPCVGVWVNNACSLKTLHTTTERKNMEKKIFVEILA